MNDIIVGSAFGLFLIENSEVLSLMLHKAVRVIHFKYRIPFSFHCNCFKQKVFVTYMENILVWLDNWPAGLKLNTELSRALFHCFIRTVYLFEGLLIYGLRHNIMFIFPNSRPGLHGPLSRHSALVYGSYGPVRCNHVPCTTLRLSEHIDWTSIYVASGHRIDVQPIEIILWLPLEPFQR